MKASPFTSQRFVVRSTLALAALIALGACQSGSGYNPFDRRGASPTDPQRQERPRNPSDIERQKRQGQDSSRAAPPGMPAATPVA
jgi:hypothetical protein